MNRMTKTAIFFVGTLLATSGAYAQGASCNDQYLVILKQERICAAKNAGMNAAETERATTRPVFTAIETKQDIETCEKSASKKFRRIASPPVGGPSCKQG